MNSTGICQKMKLLGWVCCLRCWLILLTCSYKAKFGKVLVLCIDGVDLLGNYRHTKMCEALITLAKVLSEYQKIEVSATESV